MTTVAEALVHTLSDAGVKRIYGIVGDSLNEFLKVLSKEHSVDWIHTRHEEVAAFAAGAEAHITGELTVCAGSCGPGNLHLINGLYDCQRNRVPVLAIAAHIPSTEMGGDYFQETHPCSIFQDCSYFCEFVTCSEQMPRILEIAMRTALAKRGVAVLVISGDIASKSLAKGNAGHWFKHYPPAEVIPPSKALMQAAKRLNQAKNVTIFCGIGSRNAREPLLQIAKTLNAPIVHTLRGKAYIEHDNPFDVGMTGVLGFSSGYHAMQACDTLLLVGISFPYRQFYPQKARVIQIDLEGQQLGKRTNVDVGLIGDANATLKALLPLLEPKQDDHHLKQALSHYKVARSQLDQQAVKEKNDQGLHPQYLTRLVDQHASETAIFTCDVGTPTVWAARYLTMNGKRELIGSFNHGSMANALAQGIGAAIACPDRQVIALCGDGGLSMLLGDMLTLIQHKIPLKIIVFNNKSLDFVKLEMQAVGMVEFGTNLAPANFAEIATAMGILGLRVDNASHVASNLKRVLDHHGPALLDVRVNPNELIIPPTITLEHVKGFGLYMIKAILDGKGNEILDLAKSHLWDR